MNATIEKLLTHFLRTYRDPFTAKDVSRLFAQMGVKLSVREIADFLESDPLVFPLERKLYLTRAGSAQN